MSIEIKELSYEGLTLDIEKLVKAQKEKNPKSKYVGFQIHFITEFDGQEVVASISGFAENFDLENYG